MTQRFKYPTVVAPASNPNSPKWLSVSWFQICFLFTPSWGRFPFWLIFFKGAETTNQLWVLFFFFGLQFWRVEKKNKTFRSWFSPKNTNFRSLVAQRQKMTKLGSKFNLDLKVRWFLTRAFCCADPHEHSWAIHKHFLLKDAQLEQPVGAWAPNQLGF